MSQKTQDVLLSLYADYHNGRQQPTSEAILRVLKQMLEGFQHSYVIIDALDECKQREDLLLLIEEIVSWKLGNVHILTTSRKEEDISDYLDSTVTGQICIQSALVEADIRILIQERLQNDRNLKKWAAKVKDEIESTLISDANGIPMRLNGVAEVLAIDLENGQFEPENRSPEPRDVLKVCSSLVTVSHGSIQVNFRYANNSEELRLAHFSVKEYLVGARIYTGVASSYSIISESVNLTIAQGCVAYLLHFRGANVLREYRMWSYPLVGYAARYWTRHTQIVMDYHAESEELKQPRIWSFRLLETVDCLSTSIRVFSPDKGWDLRSFDESVKLALALYYASFTGLKSIIKLLIDRGDINAQGGYYGTALQAATAGDCENVVRLLLVEGAGVNVQGGIYGTALQAAAVRGDENVIQLLLAEGANVNAKGGHYRTALQAAVAEGYENVIQLLLADGANVNALEGDFGMKLQQAAKLGHENVVRLLLAESDMKD